VHGGVGSVESGPYAHHGAGRLYIYDVRAPAGRRVS